jgi:hypothetical protein
VKASGSTTPNVNKVNICGGLLILKVTNLEKIVIQKADISYK